MLELAAYLFIVSLLSALVCTPLAIRLGKRWGVMDAPGPRKIHTTPIPLVGGWAIFLTLTLVVWVHLLGAWAIRGSSWEHSLSQQLQHHVSIAPTLVAKIAPVYLGALIIFVIGLIDDIKGMSVRSRFVVQLILAIGLASVGFHPTLDIFPPIVGGMVGVLWIVGITNAFNFLDGLDGLSTGVALVGAGALLSVMGIKDQPDVVFFLAALTGTLLGFLCFNYHPAKAFLGSSGSLLVGYLMGILTLQVTYMKPTVDNWLMPLLTPIFIVAIPLYDMSSVILIRLLQKRSIAIGDQSHFHHRLMKLGFSHRQTVSFIVILAFSIAVSAVSITEADLWRSLLILIQILSMMSLIVLAERVAMKVQGAQVEHQGKPPTSDLAEVATNEDKTR